MAVLRTIKCEICKNQETESAPGYGWPGWGHIGGIKLNGVEQPTLCPRHLAEVADFIDNMVNENDVDNS